MKTGVVEAADIRAAILIYGQLPHVDLLFEMAIVIGAHNVDNLNVYIEQEAEAEEYAKGFQPDYRCKGLK